jgi:flagella basal body P-ring formation protein FlgA
VPVPQVLEAIRAHDLLLVDTGSLSEIEVTRAGQTIGTKDIESRIARAFAGRQGLGEAKGLVVTLDREARPIQIDPASSTQLQVVRAYYDRRLGRFDVTLEIPNTRTALRYTGTLTETVEVGVLMRTVARGDVLRNSDVVIERRPKSDVGADLVTSLDQAVGLAVRQQHQSGHMLRRADLVKPDLVRRDEAVTLIFEVPGITLTMRGKALESGTEGDLVNVLNVQSKRHVQGQVTGSGRVTVTSTTTTTAPARTAAVTERSSAE